MPHLTTERMMELERENARLRTEIERLKADLYAESTINTRQAIRLVRALSLLDTGQREAYFARCAESAIAKAGETQRPARKSVITTATMPEGES